MENGKKKRWRWIGRQIDREEFWKGIKIVCADEREREREKMEKEMCRQSTHLLYRPVSKYKYVWMYFQSLKSSQRTSSNLQLEIFLSFSFSKNPAQIIGKRSNRTEKSVQQLEGGMYHSVGFSPKKLYQTNTTTNKPDNQQHTHTHIIFIRKRGYNMMVFSLGLCYISPSYLFVCASLYVSHFIKEEKGGFILFFQQLHHHQKGQKEKRA